CDRTILLSGDRASLLDTIAALSRSKEVRPSALYLASGFEGINHDIVFSDRALALVAVRFVDDEAAVAGQVHRLLERHCGVRLSERQCAVRTERQCAVRMDAIQSKVEVEELEVRAAAEFWDSIDDIDRTGAF